MQVMISKTLDMGSIRTQAVFRDDHLEMRVVLPELAGNGAGETKAVVPPAWQVDPALFRSRVPPLPKRKRNVN